MMSTPVMHACAHEHRHTDKHIRHKTHKRRAKRPFSFSPFLRMPVCVGVRVLIIPCFRVSMIEVYVGIPFGKERARTLHTRTGVW